MKKTYSQWEESLPISLKNTDEKDSGYNLKKLKFSTCLEVSDRNEIPMPSIMISCIELKPSKSKEPEKLNQSCFIFNKDNLAGMKYAVEKTLDEILGALEEDDSPQTDKIKEEENLNEEDIKEFESLNLQHENLDIELEDQLEPKEELNEEVKNEDEHNSEEIGQSDERKKKFYVSYSNELKLEFLQKYIEKREEEEAKEKPMSEQKLISEVIADLNKHINPETAKSWAQKFKSNPEYLLMLQQNKNKQVFIKGKRLTYPQGIEQEIVDWISFQRQNDIPITGVDVRTFAKELIVPIAPKFKASSRWCQKFFARNGLALRIANTKASQKLPVRWEKLASEFRESVINKVASEAIELKYVVNMDETPLFYEYLPEKVVDTKGAKNIATWKADQDKKRGTLILAVSASSEILPLVLY